MRAKSISSGSDTKSRLARAERGVLCLLQGPDPTCCSGQEVLARAPREAEPDHDTFPLLGGQNQLRGFYPEPRALAGEPHSSSVEIRYFKFGWVFFFKGFKVHVFPQLRLKRNVPEDLQGNFCARFPSLKFGAFCSTSH